MPLCPSCGKKFSDFSFGPNPATECRDCRIVGKPSPAASPAADAKSAVTGRPVVTLTLIAINIAVYIAMGLSGVSWTQPSVLESIRWGADFGPFTLSGQWWRLLTSAFIHFGIVHLAFNMWCLWDLGRTLEAFMGRKAFLLTYLLSGLAASLASSAWDPWRASAGASGAIFGVAGAFIALLYLKKTKMDPAMTRTRLKNLAIFVGYNLLRGTAGAVDNAAHIGGLVAGFVLGGLAPRPSPTPSADSPSESPALPIEQASRPELNAYPLQAVLVGGLAVLLLAAMAVRHMHESVGAYGAAVRLVQAGDLERGITQMQSAVTSDPDLALGHALLGEWHLERGNPSAAVPALERALAFYPDAYDLEHNLALAYLGSGRPNDALREINKALNLEKGDAWQAKCILALAVNRANAKGSQSDQLLFPSQPDCQQARASLASVQTTTSSPATIALPYAKLALKGEAWPLYP